MRSLIRRIAAILSTKLVLGISLITLLSYLADDPINKFLGKVLWIRIILVLLIISYSVLRLLFALRTKQTAVRADNYIPNILNNSNKEYCLILRPFGADGSIPLGKRLPEGLSGHLTGGYTGVRFPKTLEEIIEESVKDLFNCEAIALIDPNAHVITTTPKYISAEDKSWRRVIDLLLRRALIVFLVVPPQKQISKSVQWEINRVVALGLAERFIIALPPPNESGYKNSYESLVQLDELFPALREVPFKSFIIFPQGYEIAQYWIPLAKTKIIAEEAYRNALAQCLLKIKNQVGEYSFSQKYPYWNNRMKKSIFLGKNLVTIPK